MVSASQASSADYWPRVMTETSVQEQPKKSSAVKWVGVSIVYFALIIFMAWASIGKAIDTSQEMGIYQIDKTREFMGDEKAQEMKEFYDQRMRGEESPTGNESTDSTKQ